LKTKEHITLIVEVYKAIHPLYLYLYCIYCI